MSDPEPQIVVGHAYIRPLSSEANTDWVDLGLTEGIFDGSVGDAEVLATWGGETNPFAGHQWAPTFGGKHCAAAGMQERVWDDGRCRRTLTPCLLVPDHDGDHRGVAGEWLETGDPRGIVTVWLEPAEEQA